MLNDDTYAPETTDVPPTVSVLNAPIAALTLVVAVIVLNNAVVPVVVVPVNTTNTPVVPM